jgi:outer membrane protein TolC
MRLILFLAPLALLAATAQAQRPTTVIEPRARALIADLPPSPAPPLAEGPPLSLAEALTRARAASPDLAVLRERVVQASLDVGRAWALVKPTLNLNASYTRTQDAPPVFGPPPNFVAEGSPNSVQGSLVLQVPLFNGRAFPTIATANQLVDVARLTETEQRVDLLLLVAATYYSGVQLRELYFVRSGFRGRRATMPSRRRPVSRRDRSSAPPRCARGSTCSAQTRKRGGR